MEKTSATVWNMWFKMSRDDNVFTYHTVYSLRVTDQTDMSQLLILEQRRNTPVITFLTESWFESSIQWLLNNQNFSFQVNLVSSFKSIIVDLLIILRASSIGFLILQSDLDKQEILGSFLLKLIWNHYSIDEEIAYKFLTNSQDLDNISRESVLFIKSRKRNLATLKNQNITY